MNKDDITNEVNLLYEIKSPYVMRLIDHVFEDDFLYLVCEYVDGYELLYLLEQGIFLNENSIKNLIYHVLTGVNHIHSQNIIHRDLKLENIFVLFDNDKGFKGEVKGVKVVDFGLAVRKRYSKGVTGTLHYIPPEALMKLPYSNKFDAWSIGVILYVLVMGRFPFYGRNSYETAKLIKTQPVEIAGEETEDISPQCKDLIYQLLDKSPESRLSVKDAFEHQWFKSMKTGSASKFSKLETKKEGDTRFTANIKNYKKESCLLKAIKLFTIKLDYEGDEIQFIRGIFENYDRNKNGTLEYDEFVQCSKNILSKDTSLNDIEMIYRLFDIDKDRHINYDEFVGAIRDSNKMLASMDIDFLFNNIDKDRDGVIDFDELKKFIQQHRIGLDHHHSMEDLYKEIDKSGDGNVQPNELKDFLVKQIEGISNESK